MVVLLYGKLRQIAGERQIMASGTSVRSVLNDVFTQHPWLEEAVLMDGRIRTHCVLTINGQIIIDLDTPVGEADQIALFPPVAGG